MTSSFLMLQMLIGLKLHLGCMYFCLSVFGFVMMVLRILFMVIIEVGFVCAEFKFTR